MGYFVERGHALPVLKRVSLLRIPMANDSAQEEIRQWLAGQSASTADEEAARSVPRNEKSRSSSRGRRERAAVSAELQHHMLGADLTGAAHGAQANHDAETLRALEAMPVEAITKGRGTLGPAAREASVAISKRKTGRARGLGRTLPGQTTGRAAHSGSVDERDPVARLLGLTRELCDAVESNNASVAGLPGPMLEVLTGRLHTRHTQVAKAGRLVRAKRAYKLRPRGWCAIGNRLMNQLGPDGGKYLLAATTARECLGTRKAGGRCNRLAGDVQHMRRINKMWNALAASPGGTKERERLNARAAMVGARTLLAWVPKLRGALSKTIAAAVVPLERGSFIPGRDKGGEYVPDQYRRMGVLLEAVEEAGRVLEMKARQALNRTRRRRGWLGALLSKRPREKKKTTTSKKRTRSSSARRKRSTRTRSSASRSARMRTVRPSLPGIAQRAAQMKPGEVSPEGDTAAL